MRVQRLVMPDGSGSWTVLGDRGEVIAPVEGFLAHLQALGRSPETVRTYATSLKLWWEFLGSAGCGSDTATVDHVARFVAWLRVPAENVAVLEGGSARCSPTTLNRHLAALFSFYDYQARNGVPLARQLVAWRRSNRGRVPAVPAPCHRRAGGRPVSAANRRRRAARGPGRAAGGPRGTVRWSGSPGQVRQALGCGQSCCGGRPQ
jgi:integrase/recombinase XerD